MSKIICKTAAGRPDEASAEFARVLEDDPGNALARGDGAVKVGRAPSLSGRQVFGEALWEQSLRVSELLFGGCFR